MKRSLRFFIALYVAKLSAVFLKLLRRNGTLMPGLLAIAICPDFLGRMPKPEKIIGVMGTNGKTTVTNLVADVLVDSGYTFICNREGTNVNTGVASSLIANSTFFGWPKKQMALFELDERSSPLILPFVTLDMAVITNIFRDSYKRNAHVEFIQNMLEKHLSDRTKLVLNADDLICSSLKANNDRVFFGIEQMEGETPEVKNIVCDVAGCPKCMAKLDWQFIRYHHIGQAICPMCGYKNPTADYLLTDIQQENKKAVISHGGMAHEYPLLNENLINIYNLLSAVALLSEIGLKPETITAALAKRAIDVTRYHEEIVGDKKIIFHLAKGQNPVACSRAFENVKNYPGKKSVILLLDDYFDAKNSVENIAWFYDSDFEFLNDDNIEFIATCGERHWDVFVRLLMADVPESKIEHIADEHKISDQALRCEPETVFILYDIYTRHLALEMKDRLAMMTREKTS